MLAMAGEGSEVDLWQLNFMFAVTKLDPRAGRVTAEQVYWGRSSEGKEKKKIELVDCKELLPGGPRAHQSNNESFDIEKLGELGSDFLCPVGV